MFYYSIFNVNWQGYKAREMGFSLKDNPYHYSDEKYKTWREGWLSADECPLCEMGIDRKNNGYLY